MDQNIKNNQAPLVKELNTHYPFEYRYVDQLVLGQKNIKYIEPRYQNNEIYNKKIVFDIPRNGRLGAIYLESTLTTTGDNTTVQDRLGARIYSDIELQTVRGAQSLFRNTPEYNLLRLDSLNTDKLSYVEAATQPSDIFNNNTVTCFTPVYSYFFDKAENYINTNHWESLQLEIKSNSSKVEMGLPQDLTVISCRMICVYYTMDKPESFPSNDQVFLTYDSFVEPKAALSSGATSKEVQVSLKHRTIFTVNSLCQNDTTKDILRSSRLVLKNNNKILFDMPRVLNFSLLDEGEESSTFESNSGFYTYWLSLKKDRSVANFVINLSQIENPFLTVSFNSTQNANYYLYVIYEFFSLVTVSPTGQVSRNFNI